MGSLLSNLKVGDIVSTNLELSIGMGSGFRHFGVVVDSYSIIYKDEHSLRKVAIRSGAWSKAAIVRSGGSACAAHAIARYQKGRVVGTDRREDIVPYDVVKANCQHFANDCFIGLDRAGESDDVSKVSTVVRVVKELGPHLLSAGSYLVSQFFKDTKKVSNCSETSQQTMQPAYTKERSSSPQPSQRTGSCAYPQPSYNFNYPPPPGQYEYQQPSGDFEYPVPNGNYDDRRQQETLHAEYRRPSTPPRSESSENDQTLAKLLFQSIRLATFKK
jgi:hypothetical protein